MAFAEILLGMSWVMPLAISRAVVVLVDIGSCTVSFYRLPV